MSYKEKKATFVQDLDFNTHVWQLLFKYLIDEREWIECELENLNSIMVQKFH